MHIHEFQTKEILKEYGISIPPYAIVETVEEAREAADRMGLDKAVLKIQVHAGGRGKGGGVKLAQTPEEIVHAARKLLGMRLINAQTGPEGLTAHKILISPLVPFKKEYYVGAIIDRKDAQGLLIISPEGGMEIEEIAETHPDKLLKMPIPLNGKLRNYQLLQLVKFMGWQGKEAQQGMKLFAAFCKAFVETDADLLELNPLVTTEEGALVALDAKLSVDDNALYRQPRIAAFYDAKQVLPEEARAKQFDLAYIALGGEIGCMVNGAGLAMATMDIIRHAGGTPSNFLDVGGGATQEKVAEGFKILLGDPKVKAILVNIFGGIMNCLTLSTGIVAAAKELQLKVPLIVRMEGTNVEQGKKLLQESGLNIQIAADLGEAAQMAVAAAKGK